MIISEVINPRLAEFVGTCANSFDQVGNCVIDQLNYRDVSDFAQALENTTIKIPENEFYYNVNVWSDIEKKLSKNLDFLYDERNDVFMIYDNDSEIHYFFR